MPTTLKEIAVEAGVSLMTASKVLNHGHSPTRRRAHERAEEVWRVAKRLGYMPNQAARAMVSGRFNSVALVGSTNLEHSYLPRDLMAGISQALCASGTHLTLSFLTDEQLTSDEYVPAILRELVADGLLIDYPDDMPTRLAELTGRHRIPAVFINAKLPEYAVHPDDEGGGHELTRRLLERGCRQIVYLEFRTESSLPGQHYSVRDRRAGYLRAMREGGLTARPIHRPEELTVHSDWHEFLETVLTGGNRPDAIIAAGETPLVVRMAERFGRPVGRDLTIATFASPSEWSGLRRLGLATALVPMGAVGETAVSMLQRMITGTPAPQPSVAVPYRDYDFSEVI